MLGYCNGVQKLGYTGGGPYMNGYYSPMYPSQAMVGGNTLMPMYPLYQYHQTHTMGLPAHIFQPPTAGHVAIVSKPSSVTPNTGASHGNTPTISSQCVCKQQHESLWSRDLVIVIEFSLVAPIECKSPPRSPREMKLPYNPTKFTTQTQLTS